MGWPGACCDMVCSQGQQGAESSSQAHEATGYRSHEHASRGKQHHALAPAAAGPFSPRGLSNESPSPVPSSMRGQSSELSSWGSSSDVQGLAPFPLVTRRRTTSYKLMHGGSGTAGAPASVSAAVSAAIAAASSAATGPSGVRRRVTIGAPALYAALGGASKELARSLTTHTAHQHQHQHPGGAGRSATSGQESVVGRHETEDDFVSARGTFTSVPPAVASRVLQQLSQPATGHTGATAAAGGAAAEYEADTALLQDASLLYAQHPCRAYQIVQQYCREAGITAAQLAELAPQGREGHNIRRLAGMVTAVQKGLTDMDDDTGWSVIRDDDLQMLYRHDAKDGTVHHFRGRCVLDTPVEDVLSVLREFDLFKVWTHYVQSSDILAVHSPAEMLVLAVLWLPWPMNSAAMLLEVMGVDLLEEMGCFLLAFHSPRTADLLPGTVPSTFAKRRKVFFLPGSCLALQPLPPLKPGGSNRTFVALQSHVDARVSVPCFLVSFVLKVLVPLLFNVAMKVLAALRGQGPKGTAAQLLARLSERASFYGRIAERGQAYVEHLVAAAATAAGAAPAGPSVVSQPPPAVPLVPPVAAAQGR